MTSKERLASATCMVRTASVAATGSTAGTGASTFLLEIQNPLLPKSEAGQAVAYTLKNWAALTCYVENPDLSIDNNHTERALRCFAVGRANWTFFGSDRGGAAQFCDLLRTREDCSVRLVPGYAHAYHRISHHQAG